MMVRMRNSVNYHLVVANALETFNDKLGILRGHLAVGVGVGLGLRSHLSGTSPWMLVAVEISQFLIFKWSYRLTRDG